MTKTIFTAILLTLLAWQTHGQQIPNDRMKRAMDSVKAIYLDNAALRTPMIRQAGVHYDVLGESNIDSKLHDNPFLRGKTQISRMTAYLTIPVAHFGKNRMAVSFAANHQSITLSNIESKDPSFQITETKFNKDLISTSLSFTRIDSLWRRPIVYSVTGTLVIDPNSGQYRLVAMGVASLTLKHTAQTTLSLGLMFLRDPSVAIPVIPFISYYHRFNKPHLELFADPGRVSLRRELTPKHILWLNNNIGGNLSMFRIDNDHFPHNSVYSTLEIKSGLTYEYRLMRKTVLGISGGVLNTMYGKMLEQTKSTDPLIKSTHSMVPYSTVSVTCLPFWKGFVRK